VANVVISNVPGPPMPLYMAGARMLTNYPTSIVVHGMALNITVQSYDQSLDFGLMADAQAMPDVHDAGRGDARGLRRPARLPRPGEPDHRGPGRSKVLVGRRTRTHRRRASAKPSPDGRSTRWAAHGGGQWPSNRRFRRRDRQPRASTGQAKRRRTGCQGGRAAPEHEDQRQRPVDRGRRPGACPAARC
jgi:hypothetical protein